MGDARVRTDCRYARLVQRAECGRKGHREPKAGRREDEHDCYEPGYFPQFYLEVLHRLTPLLVA